MACAAVGQAARQKPFLACDWRPAAAAGKHANKRTTQPRPHVAFTHKTNGLRCVSCRRLLVPCKTRSSLLPAEDIALQNQTSPSISKFRLCLCHCHCRQPTLRYQPRHACLSPACERFWRSWSKEQRAGLHNSTALRLRVQTGFDTVKEVSRFPSQVAIS